MLPLNNTYQVFSEARTAAFYQMDFKKVLFIFVVILLAIFIVYQLKAALTLPPPVLESYLRNGTSNTTNNSTRSTLRFKTAIK